ncbi:hypothetical protein SAMN06296952_2350 [Oscillospiraceae bacterium]|nr:hypothetical protein SAMN06296952_2350 [Oscillospiraceae bacterium]
MKRLSEMAPGEEGVISSVSGDNRYVGRIISIGITPGCIPDGGFKNMGVMWEINEDNEK